MSEPVLTSAEHMLNLCTIASGMIVSPQNPIGTIGEDALIIYHKLLAAYAADATLPVAQLAKTPPAPAKKTARKRRA